MSSMKDGSALAIWAEMGRGVCCRKGGFGGSRVEGEHSYKQDALETPHGCHV